MDPNLQTRREFLGRGVTLAAVAATVPSFLGSCAHALDDPQAKPAQRGRGTDHPILVVVQLAGGNDGLNTLVPYTDDAYYRNRPTLGIPAKEVLRLNERLGLNPGLVGLKSLWDAGELGIVQAVGYPNPNRSHFRSMEIWETASDSDKQERRGWLGRYFDCACRGHDIPTTQQNSLGVQLGRRETQAFTNDSSVGITLTRPDQYRWFPGDEGQRGAAVYADLNKPSRDVDAQHATTLDFLQRTAMNANLSSAEITRLAAAHRGTVEYPEGRFAQDLKLVSQMIAGGLPTRVYFASLGGFDTHAQQDAQHPRLMTELGEGLAAFLKDMKDQGNHERVVVMTFSEFGRRVHENGSKGTDHGSGSLLFLAGGPVKAGLYGQTPSLTDLLNGDVRYNVDFRSVYATVLDQWLKVDPKAVLGRDFARLACLRV